MCMYVRMYVHLCLCMCVSIYVSTCMYECMFMYLCVYACFLVGRVLIAMLAVSLWRNGRYRIEVPFLLFFFSVFVCVFMFIIIFYSILSLKFREFGNLLCQNLYFHIFLLLINEMKFDKAS